MTLARPGVLSPEGHREQDILSEWKRHAMAPQSSSLSLGASRYSRAAGFLFGASAVRAANADLRAQLDRCRDKKVARQ